MDMIRGMYVCVNTYIYIYIYIHTHTYMRMYILLRKACSAVISCTSSVSEPLYTATQLYARY
jgi:hypothetical protein